ncbi:hypothetical protein [Flavobacterium soli]|uniref:hypothetical protein n=1 Tax=Flavobacterium soli TaxID=344881 RepID=UPI00042929D7|nr:hypothetical protein [Flavobacterium soli]
MAELIVRDTDKKVFIDIKEETIGGFIFKLTTDGALDASSVHLFDNHIVTLSRFLDGKSQGDLFRLSLYQIYAIVHAGDNDFTQNSFFTGLFGSNTFLLQFLIGTNFVLKNGEYFRLEFTNTSFNAEPVSAVIETIPSIGLQSFVPVFDVYNVDTQLTKYDFNFGNDVSKIIFLQRELPNAVTALLRTPLKKLSIKSDKLDAQLSKELIYIQNRTYMGGLDSSGAPVILLSSKNILNNLKVTLECANASPNRQLIVCRAVQNPQIFNNLQRKTAEHQAENIAHLKSNDGMCGCTH